MALSPIAKGRLGAIPISVVDWHSPWGSALSDLVEFFDDVRDNHGISAVKEVLRTLASQRYLDLRQSPVFEAVGYEAALRGKRSGRSSWSGKGLRWTWRFKVRPPGEQAQRHGTMGDFELSGHHAAYTLAFERLAEDGFLQQFKKEHRKMAEGRQPKNLEERVEENIAFSPELRSVMEKLGVDPDALEQATEFLRYGPDILSGKMQEVAYLLDPVTHGKEINRLLMTYGENSIEDEKLVKALLRTMSPFGRPRREDVALVRSWTYQYLKLPAAGLIGTLKKDIEFLARGDVQASDGARYPLTAEDIAAKMFRPARIYRNAPDDAPELLVSDVLDPSKTQVITIAAAVGLERAFPGIADFRKKYNKMALYDFFDVRDPHHPGPFHEALQRLKKAFEETIRSLSPDNGGEYILVPKQQSIAKELLRIAESRARGSEIEKLAMLLAMPDAQKLFRAASIISRQLLRRGGEDDAKAKDEVTRRDYVLAKEYQQEKGIDTGWIVEVLQHIYWGAQETPYQKELRKKAGINAAQWGIILQRYLPGMAKDAAVGLIEAYYAGRARSKKQGPSVLERLKVLTDAFTEVDSDLGRKIGYLRWTKENLRLETGELSVETGKRAKRKDQQRFSIDDYVMVQYVSAEQRNAIDTAHRVVSRALGFDDTLGDKAKSAAADYRVIREIKDRIKSNAVIIYRNSGDFFYPTSQQVIYPETKTDWGTGIRTVDTAGCHHEAEELRRLCVVPNGLVRTVGLILGNKPNDLTQQGSERYSAIRVFYNDLKKHPEKIIVSPNLLEAVETQRKQTLQRLQRQKK